MFFKKKAKKELLAGHKTISIEGIKFIIRKINPLIDFELDQMPSIFTEISSKRKPAQNDATIKRAKEDIMRVIEKGVVEPEIIPVGKGEERGKEIGVTIEDIFRSESVAIKLYIEIIAHSLNHFRGLKGAFFLRKIRHSLYIEWRRHTAQVQQA